MAKCRAMIDSYTIAFALIDGYARKVIEKWIRGDFEMIVSSDSLEEVRGFLAKGEVPDALADDLVNLFHAEGEVVKAEPSALSGSYRILESAISGGADFIISEDQRLLRLEGFKLIEVLSPKDFLERVG